MKRSIVLLAGLAAASGLARAEGERAPSVPQGWYVAPMASWMHPDKGRCHVDSGLGGALSLGHRGDLAALELWGEYRSLSQSGCTYTVPNPDTTPGAPPRIPVTTSGDVKLDTVGLALAFTPFQGSGMPWLTRVFGLVGFGIQLRENQPGYPNGKAMLGDVGAGYLHPFQLFGFDMALRTEARYRFGIQQPPYPSAVEEDPPPKHSYQDVLVNVGLQIALSRPQEMPPPAPEKVEVVPPAEPAPPPVAVAPAPEPAPVVAPTTTESDAGAVLETAKAGDTIVLHGVTFDTAKARLTANAKTILDGVAESLNKRPELKVEIGGHTDNRGSAGFNQKLSEKRAKSVLDYLVSKGVDAGRLSAQGYGLSQPVDSNDTDDGREHNRRVELKVLQ